ncbi:MAG: hypothetical protein KGI08_03610 [Thaumarchaeota archaeon]|nr:hypothetical protein [Nitrososphaerota archaeon]
MPALLDGVAQVPIGYNPWYIYTVNLVASPTAFTIYDVLFPDSSGNFDKLVTTDSVLTAGYAFACADYATGDTTAQVLAPGSLVAMIALTTTLTPFCLVKFSYSSPNQTAVIATATDLAAGKVIGRYMANLSNYVQISAANDPIIVRSGVL